ncbi:MAG: flagellar motor switch protein FliN [Candidatus Eisenbacteria bacterium]|nr:flagellar motor switch protein FliN [Candidatus Eisenbacteria bacterium]
MWPDEVEPGEGDDLAASGSGAEEQDLDAMANELLGGAGLEGSAAPDLSGGDEDDPVAAEWAAMLAEQQAKAGAASPASSVQPLQFPQMQGIEATKTNGSIELLMDVKLPISVELGRAQMEIKEIMEFAPGTVVELDKMAGDMVDILVNGRLVAQGEVVVVDEHFGVRVTHLISPRDRVKSLA